MQITGWLMEGGKRQASSPALHGRWDSKLMVSWGDGSKQLLWQKNPPYQHPSRYVAICF